MMETAKYLFIGGPWDGDVHVVDVKLREMAVRLPIPGTQKGAWVEDEKAPRWLRWFGRIFPSFRPSKWDDMAGTVGVSTTVYIKRQVVHREKHSGLSIPVFVEKSIADNDKWLKELPTALIDALWTQETARGSEARKPKKKSGSMPQRRCWNCKKGLRRGEKAGKARYVYCRKHNEGMGILNCCESYKRAW